MKVPLSWLSEYVDLSGLTAKDLSDKLTFSGVEVEGIDEVGATLGDAFVVGEVLTCVAHPNSDHLHVCTVSDGKQELQIVCGAPNCTAGIKVPLARIGAVVPEGGFTIKQAKLRGVASSGMLCSARELKLSEDHAGLMILDQALQAGTPLRDILPPPETVLDLEITWNRPDCLSIIGIAREFAALLGRPVKLPDVAFPEAAATTATLAAVQVEEPALCPRYTARVLTTVQDGPAPAWMRRRLELCGVRPISLIVDVTNYVMLECGQPLHAFDYRRVTDQTIVVRRARPGECMKTLDGVERKLDEQMLVIADPVAALAVAGVMGGAGSEIAVGGTDSVLLESATFASPSVKRTATLLNLRTESSYRFERGVDPGLADWASRRASSLLARHGGATVSAQALDADARPKEARRVTLRFARGRDTIGVALEDARMVGILEALGLKAEARTPEAATFVIPSWRLDLEVEADLIEEIARVHGLAAIHSRPPQSVVVPDAHDAGTRAVDRCRQILLSLGFTEAVHYSFMSATDLDVFDKRAQAARLVLPNPVSADYAVMRDSLVPQLTAALGRNHARQVDAAALFELGRVFWRDADDNPAEETRVALGLYGPIGRSGLDRRRPVGNAEAALWLKGTLETLATRLHAGAITLRAAAHPAMESGWASEVLLDGEVIGMLGLVAGSMRHQWRMACPLVVAEVKLLPLLGEVERVPQVKSVPAYPSIRRDLALVAPCELTHGEIVAEIRRTAPSDLTEIALFDIFESKEIGSDRRSLAYTLEFRSSSRTLTDDEVNAAFRKIIAALKSTLRVEIREG